MLKNPAMAEDINPAINMPSIPEFNMSGSFISPAPNIIGVANKKEKRAASFPDNPKNNAAAMVMPERDTPGIIAMACAIPIKMADFKVMEFIWRFFSPVVSEMNKIMLAAISAMETKIGFLNIVSALPSRKYPASAPGIVAIKIKYNILS